jgi:hypothetical protein
MTITKLHNGALEIATIQNGYRVARVYCGYTRKEAIKLFRAFLKTN